MDQSRTNASCFIRSHLRRSQEGGGRGTGAGRQYLGTVLINGGNTFLRGKLGNLTALDGEQEIPLNQQAVQAFNALEGPLKLLCSAYVDPGNVRTYARRRVLG